MAGEKILLIDDQEDIRTVGKLSLAKVGGFEVHLASGGAEGIETASRVRPQLILLDVMMPDLDGPETLRRLRETPSCQQIPVVFLTAKTEEAEIQELHSLGASGVIAKPFDPTKLAAQVQEFLAP